MQFDLTQVKKEQSFNPLSNSEDNSSLYRKPRSRNNCLISTFGKWTSSQNLSYIIFMDYYRQIFNSRQKRRLTRIFKAMSDCIQTRTPSQCRSHHQKLLEKYGNFKKIISVFKSQTSQNYQQAFLEFSDSQKQHPNLKLLLKSQSLVQTRNIQIQTDPVVILDDGQIIDLPTFNYYVMSNFLQLYWQTFQG